MPIKRHGAVVMGVAMVIASVHTASAATNAELEQRLDKLEQMLQQTRTELDQQKQSTAQAKAEAEQARQQASQNQVASQNTSKSQSNNPIGTFQIGEHTTAKIGGYIKADTNYSHYDNGDASKRGELFYTPAGVPVGPDSTKSTDSTAFTAQQTRLNLTTITHLGGHKIKGFIETDFYGDESEGQDRVVNDYSPRLRHAYIELDDTWLFGQTWSNFMDMKAYPETLDFIGPDEGQIFVRQAQIRYTRGGFSAALENPETTFEFDSTPSDARVTSPTHSDHYPELTLGYTDSENWGHISAGAVAKTVSTDGDFDTGVRNTNDTAFGYGLRLSGSFNLTQSGDDLKFQGFYGDGLGRYVAIGAVPGGYVRSNGDIDTIKAYGGYLDYRHFWTPQWRSNLVLGALAVDNPNALRDSLITKTADSVHANLLWSPVDPLTLGGEYLFATRQVENGYDGNINRVQFSAKYAF